MSLDITLLGIFAGLVSVLLGVYVYVQNPKRGINISFSLLSLLLGIWAFTLYLYVNPIWFTSEFWIRSVYVEVIALLVPMMYLMYHFPQADSYTRRFLPHVLIFLTFGLVFIWSVLFSDLVVKEVIIQESGNLKTILGAHYSWWGAYVGFNVTLFIYPLWKRWQSAHGIEKHQIKFLALGIVLLVVGALSLDVVLPAITGSTEYFCASSLFTLVFIAFTSYAIVRHRFMDIRIAARSTLTRILIVLTLSGVFYLVGMLFVLKEIALTQQNVTTTAVSLGVLILVLFKPLEKLFQKSADQTIFRREFAREGLLHQLVKRMAESIDLQELENNITTTLKDVMLVSFVKFNVGGYRKDIFLVQVRAHSQIIVYDEIEHELINAENDATRQQLEKTQKAMQKEKIGVVLPLISTDSVIGTMRIGTKPNQEAFTSIELEILQTLAYQAGVAIEKASLLEETQNFNETLQNKVDRTTFELRKAYEELKQLDKMKDELIGIASHELLTPLSVIKNLLWTVMNVDQNELSPKTSERIAHCFESSEHTIDLINDMLMVSKLEGGQIQLDMAKQKIEPIIEKVMDDFAISTQEKKVTLKFDKPSQKIPKIECDQDRIRRIITNLVSNAFKYTPAGGQITIRVILKDENIEVSVQDTGEGISKEDLPRLFKKFGRLEGSFTSAAKAGGTGLGLYITKRILELHNGKIRVKSKEGKGSTFTFSLPV